ncbi:MAG: DMT family transporter [Alphaproteobacteria bacterium]
MNASSAPGGLPAPVRGVLWMVVSAICFSTMTASIRPASADMHPLQVLFFRNLIGLALMMPWILRSGIGAMRSKRLPLHILYASLVYLSMSTWYYAINKVTLVDAVALSFTIPFFTTGMAALFLGERVRWRRWLAIATGFAGALLVLRPGFQTIDPNMGLILLNILGWAAAVIMIKVLNKVDSTNAIVSYMFILLTPVSLPAALDNWTDPTWHSAPWILLLGLAGWGGHLCATKAVSLAPTSIVMPIEFIRLPLLGLIGFLAYGELPDHWTLIGSAVIVAAALYVGHREARVEAERAGRDTAPT